MHIRSIFLLLGLLSWCYQTQAQKQQVLQEDLDSLKNYELALSGFAGNMVNSEDEQSRQLSSYYFIKTLIKAFKVENSFYYPFDSVAPYISILTSPDEKFRLFSWNLSLEDRSYRYYGAIQLNPDQATDAMVEASKERYFFPLIDRSDQFTNPTDTVVDFNHWYGALYYKIVHKSHEGKDYYTLLGWDGNTQMSNVKLIDVLVFEEGTPTFGVPIFDFDPKVYKKQTRVIFEFSEQAAIVLRYIEEEDIIIYEHVAPVKPSDEGYPETYLPDGTFDYMEYDEEDGFWVKKELLFKDKVLPNDGP